MVEAGGLLGAGVDWSRLLEVDMLLRLLLQALLLGASAFFSGSEVALFSLSKAELGQLRRERNPRVGALDALLEQPRRLIISILCGNEFINVAAAANMAAILLALFDEASAGIFNMLVMVPLLLLFGEVTPKTIAISDPVRVSTRIVARPMHFWVRFVAPLRWAVRMIADRLTTLIVGEEKSPENILLADEIRTLVRDLQETGELQPAERALVDALLAAGATEVAAAMRPRTQMAFVESTASLATVRDAMMTERQQRIPIYSEHRDNLVGFVYAEDVMALALEDEDLERHPIAEMLHPAVVVPPTKRLDEMLEYFLEHHALAAVVVNEFGGVDGLITVRDLVDFVFEPVSATSAPAASHAGPVPGTFEVPGDMKLGDFNALTNFGIRDPRMTTIGGVVFRHLDRLPVAGDEVEIAGVRIRVLAMAGHRIASVLAGRGSLDAAPEARE